MTTFLQFVLFGFGSGSIVALLGLGLVLVYRGSGTINFAQGSLAMLGAFDVHELREQQGLSMIPALVLGILSIAVVGALIQLVLMRPLRDRSPLIRVIATLGVLSIVQSSILLRYGSHAIFVGSTLPTDPVKIGDVQIGQQSLWLLGIAVAVTALLTVLSTQTKLGLAISASAANQRAAAALGFSPNLLSAGTWALGGALAGTAGAFLPSLKANVLSINDLGLTIISALAAALLGGFKSYPAVLLGGLLVGVTQSECANYVSITGVSDSVPFGFLVLVLLVRGRGLPVRGTTADRLPAIGAPVRNPLVAGGFAIVAALASATLLPTTYALAVTVTATIAIIALSVVVVTGYAGQLSLAQFALGGIGAWGAGRLVSNNEWPFELGVVAGVVLAVVIGVIFGLPALRTRGVDLAVVTLGLGFAAWSLIFNSTDLTGRLRGTPLGNQTLFGLPIDTLAHPGTYSALCILVFAVCAIGISNLRKGRAGRRLLAVRSNERAAASLGISVVQAKIYAFALGSAVAGLGGILYAFSYQAVQYNTLFDPFSSITVMTFAVIGGIGYVSGPIYGSSLAAGGLGALLTAKLFGGIDEYLPLIGGIALIQLLLIAPNGLARLNIDAVEPIVGRLLPRRGHPLASAGASPRVRPRVLEVRGVTVRFGGVTALQDVDLVVPAGQVIGVLGPNGAGKTTLIDAITGYTKPQQGTLTIGGGDLGRLSPSRRSRAGLSRSFQSLELFDDLTVRENLLAAADDHAFSAWITDLVRPGAVEVPAAVARAVEAMDLGDVLDLRCEELSYGRRRLVAIARALATEPSVLLLDEPAAGLDEEESRVLGELLRHLADERGIGILLIEHDVPMVLRTADRIVVLEFGRQIAEGTPAEIRADAAVRAAYLGTRTDAA